MERREFMKLAVGGGLVLGTLNVIAAGEAVGKSVFNDGAGLIRASDGRLIIDYGKVPPLQFDDIGLSHNKEQIAALAVDMFAIVERKVFDEFKALVTAGMIADFHMTCGVTQHQDGIAESFFHIYVKDENRPTLTWKYSYLGDPEIQVDLLYLEERIKLFGYHASVSYFMSHLKAEGLSIATPDTSWWA